MSEGCNSILYPLVNCWWRVYSGLDICFLYVSFVFKSHLWRFVLSFSRPLAFMIAAGLFASSAIPSLAEDAKVDPGPELSMVVPGSENKTRSQRLATTLPWYADLDAAGEAAARQGKLVFWLHLLGNIDGFT